MEVKRETPAPPRSADDDVADRGGGRVGGLLRLRDRLDRVQARRPWLAVPVATAKKFGEDRAGNLAALLAYYGFFSIFPLLLVLVTVVGYVLSGNEDLQRDILDSALAEFPVVGDQLRENTGRLDTSGFALAVGVGSAIWAGIGVIKAAQNAMNDIWDVPMRRRPNLFVAILRSFGMLAVLAAGLILTTVLTGAMGAISSSLVPKAVGVVLSAALNVGLFLIAFRVLTTRDVRTPQLWPGATIAGLAWVGLQMLGGYLVKHQVSTASETYGAFAVVIGLLWWIFLLAQIVLFAAELNVVLADRLWPRSLSGIDRHSDRRTLRQHAQVEERTPEEDIEVRFRDKP